jgi:membrane protein required for colicin V production
MIDILIISVLAFALIRGLFKGFIVSVFSLVGWIVALLMANAYATTAAGYISNFGDISGRFSFILSFILIVIAVVLVFHFLAKMLKSIAKAILLGWLDKLLGAAFSFCKYLLILSLAANAFVWLNDRFLLLNDAQLAASRLFEPVKEVIYTVQLMVAA